MMRARTARWLAALAPIAVTVLLLPQVFVSPRQASDDFWKRFHIVGSEIEQYDDLKSMAGSADAVVIGEIIDVTRGRIFGEREETLPNPADTQVLYATLTVDVSELLAGSLPDEDPQTISLELILGTPDADADDLKLPSEPAIFFLRNKGREAQLLGFPQETIEQESPFYRLVIRSALLRIFEGRVVPAFRTEEPFLLALDGTPVDEVTAEVIAADRN